MKRRDYIKAVRKLESGLRTLEYRHDDLGRTRTQLSETNTEAEAEAEPGNPELRNETSQPGKQGHSE